MKHLYRLLAVLIVAVIVAGLFFRFAPVEPDNWHVDPLTVETPNTENYYLLRPAGGDGPAPVFQRPPDRVARAVQEVIQQTPRAAVLAGSAEAGHVTVVVRSQLMGFPDFVTVKLLEVEGGTALAIFSRSQYGQSDLGVNKARVEDWLEALETRLQQ